MPGLGRNYIPDDRDTNFPMSARVPDTVPGVSYRYWWPSGWWGDQGNQPWCVAYSWLHWAADGPTTNIRTRPKLAPEYLYCEAQKLDPWDGDCDNHKYDGTSVRAGAKVLAKYNLIDEYRWAWGIDTVINALLSTGPVVVGTMWYRDMFYPDGNGVITPTGTAAGGHAYVINGVNVNREIVRIKNSWGRNWGINGYAYMSLDDMDSLIRDRGEACLPIVN